LFFPSSFFLAYSQPPQIGCLPYFHTWCCLSANLRCRSETCCTRLAENTGRKKLAKNHHLGTIAQLCRAISSQLRHVSTIGKNVKQQYVLHVPQKYGQLWPTSGWDRFTSLGHPCKFQRLSRVGSVTARQSSSQRQPNFEALNRGGHLCLAGRPSRWALAHISNCNCLDKPLYQRWPLLIKRPTSTQATAVMMSFVLLRIAKELLCATDSETNMSPFSSSCSLQKHRKYIYISWKY